MGGGSNCTNQRGNGGGGGGVMKVDHCEGNRGSGMGVGKGEWGRKGIYIWEGGRIEGRVKIIGHYRGSIVNVIGKSRGNREKEGREMSSGERI